MLIWCVEELAASRQRFTPGTTSLSQRWPIEPIHLLSGARAIYTISANRSRASGLHCRSAERLDVEVKSANAKPSPIFCRSAFFSPPGGRARDALEADKFASPVWIICARLTGPMEPIKKNRQLSPGFSEVKDRWHQVSSLPTNQTPMSKTADPIREPKGFCLEPQPGSAPLASNDAADDATARAVAAVRSWRPPPNWSLCDWHREAKAIVAAAGCRAAFDYDPKQGIPRAAFIYKRAVASVWTRYRQEWAYGLRFASALPKTAQQPASAPRRPNDSVGAMGRLLCEAFNQLPSLDRWLLRWTGGSSSSSFGTARRRISLRKRCAFPNRRSASAKAAPSIGFAESAILPLVSQFLSVVAAFLDSLDLLPAADFWL
jgi:hypothetical protein